MINLYPASSRYSTDHGWLKSNFSFSFGDYYDPENSSFGPLRVLNDDIIAGGKGFGAHPHREMEIVTIVLKGQLKHEDSTGHSAITTFGQIQRMSAGTGIIHSEVNPGDEDVSLLQLWFMPNEKKRPPSYETTNYDLGQLKNDLLPVVSNHSSETVAHIYQDMTIYLSDLEAGRSLEFNQDAGRRIFIFVIEGDLSLNETSQLKQRDSARIEAQEQLHIQTDSGALFMIIDLP
jgi:redox-sensitive bicupin YhaK (pirin superfamily)